MTNTFGVDIIPDNDEQRIAVLKKHKILDTPAEDAFDSIVKLATEIFEVPMALISFVDSENVFHKANVGMENIHHCSRGISLCALSILNKDVTVFEDAENEDSLSSNPLVTGDFGLKFYAGAPLITPDGYTIGTICILDNKTRSFESEDEKVLKGLSQVVMGALDLRMNLVNQIEKQKIAEELLIKTEAEQYALNELQMESNEELAVINEELTAANEELVSSYDKLKTISERLGESESRFRNMIDQSPVAMMVTSGKDLVVDAINPVMLEILGNNYRILGKPIFDAMPELATQGFRELIYEVYDTGTPFYAQNAPVIFLVDGKETIRYFNLAYTPIREAGTINAVLQTAIEITSQIVK